MWKEFLPKMIVVLAAILFILVGLPLHLCLVSIPLVATAILAVVLAGMHAPPGFLDLIIDCLASYITILISINIRYKYSKTLIKLKFPPRALDSKWLPDSLRLLVQFVSLVFPL